MLVCELAVCEFVVVLLGVGPGAPQAAASAGTARETPPNAKTPRRDTRPAPRLLALSLIMCCLLFAPIPW
jgi:hypothetical protein